MLWLDKKKLILPSLLGISVIPSIMTNMHAHNNLFLFMIGQHIHILLIGIDDIDALDWHERLFFPPFFGINVILSIVTKMDAHIDLLFFMIRHHKRILLIGIDDIKALA